MKITIIMCLDVAICGLDFNPLGTLVASTTNIHVCLISDINTNAYKFHLQMGSETGIFKSYSFFIIRICFTISYVVAFTAII